MNLGKYDQLEVIFSLLNLLFKKGIYKYMYYLLVYLENQSQQSFPFHVIHVKGKGNSIHVKLLSRINICIFNSIRRKCNVP